ncbi:hypothetical protein CEXT_270361 [Caerostris extrusa]|uniref:Uncharacterized protein n=1 Tax=Caerostris extrusa TaxID=172846 RepID=A0AAV4XTX3_CAEEX|nr:hypothetical protein CEXT_270361 [Caerostris extrusa]
MNNKKQAKTEKLILLKCRTYSQHQPQHTLFSLPKECLYICHCLLLSLIPGSQRKRRATGHSALFLMRLQSTSFCGTTVGCCLHMTGIARDGSKNWQIVSEWDMGDTKTLF